jgi:hypothetical protein
MQVSVVDGGREGAERDLNELIDRESEILGEGSVGAGEVRAVRGPRDPQRRLGWPNGGKRMALEDKVSGAVRERRRGPAACGLLGRRKGEAICAPGQTHGCSPTQKT